MKKVVKVFKKVAKAYCEGVMMMYGSQYMLH